MTPVPFPSAQAAWRWAKSSIEGTFPRDTTPRPCSPEQVVDSVNRLWQEGKITLLDYRALRLGNPTPWVWALLSAKLQTQGIVSH